MVCVSEAFRKEVCKKTGISVSRTQVVYHGVSPAFRTGKDLQDQDTVRNKLGLEYPFVLSVSTINPHKNYETLIRAFSRVIESPELSAYHLLIAGGIGVSSTYEMLLKLVEDLNLKDKVNFLGRVDHKNLVSYYRAADVFVFPSRLETFGHPLIEAMAAGTPVVSSDLPVCQEICQDAALYFEPEDDVLLARHIQRVLRNQDLGRKLARRGVERSRIFSWDVAARQTIEVFQQVAGNSTFR